MIENRRAVKPKLKIFTFAELQIATRNFPSDTMVAESSFGPVFKGWLDAKTYASSNSGGGIVVAVKQSDPYRIKGLKKWQANVKLLGKFNHPNIVKLLGYCWEDTTFLLVYEYMEKGNLENHLFRNEGSGPSADIVLGYDFELENLGPANGHVLPVDNTFYYAAPKYIANGVSLGSMYLL
ncbi:hypothetical protein L6452_08079 [Arctium lappa]|uniref:Uncharacterized protein n=1 Tax=Arctium lappa TaxID=4217 RepID=A0ACB9DGX5_ARCLA|nr:hypothetical protein L6452_08079 [Arctium lappa]